jgi:hypothetical protein
LKFAANPGDPAHGPARKKAAGTIIPAAFGFYAVSEAGREATRLGLQREADRPRLRQER